MCKRLCPPFLVLLATLLATPLLLAQTYGIFTGSTDIGKTKKGGTSYSAKTGDYRVTGGGRDMWGAADDFHFTWLKITGDATLTADVHFPQGTVPLEKGVLIFRESLNPSSPYADVAIHGDGHVTFQFRKLAAGDTEDVTAAQGHSARLRIERKQNVFTAYAGPDDAHLTRISSTTVGMPESVYVGLGVCAHDDQGLATITFSKIQLERGADDH